jgi:hypothetical protein
MSLFCVKAQMQSTSVMGCPLLFLTHCKSMERVLIRSGHRMSFLAERKIKNKEDKNAFRFLEAGNLDHKQQHKKSSENKSA